MNSPGFIDTLKELEQRFSTSNKSSLSNIQSFLKRLGDPHKHLPPTFHIAGTNGKGSTAAFLKAILMAAGYRVHIFTSPHLVRFTERIVLENEEITEEIFLHFLKQVLNALKDEPLTWFELMTAVALLAFSKTPGDVVILETGMGGRLDATNVIEHPICTLITSISLDHQAFLGNEMSQIAVEKAGIFKEKCPVITCSQPTEVMTILEKNAQGKNCHFYSEPEDWKVNKLDQQFEFEFKGKKTCYPLPALKGQHQLQNAGLALTALNVTADSFPMSDTAIHKGLTNVQWPARLQLLKDHPYSNLMPINTPLYLDCAHNEGSMQVLVDFIQTLHAADHHQSSPPPLIIFGALRKRNIAPMLKILYGHVQEIIGVPIKGEDSYSGDEIADCAVSIGFGSYGASGMHQAIEYASKILFANQSIIICGSLYLAGQVLAEQQPSITL